MIAAEEMVVTVTHGGYVKRNPKTLYRAQRRGGRGITGAATHEEDFVAQLFVASTHDTLLMFTNKGRVYSKKMWEVPQAGRTAKGKAFVNLIPLQEGERVVALLPVREFSEGAFVVMATRRGLHQEDLAATPSPTSAAPASSRCPSPTTTTWSACASPRARPTSCSARATAGPFASARRTCARWAARRAACAASGCARRRTTRWSAWRSSRARSRRRCSPSASAATASARRPRDYPTKNRGGKGVITIKTTERNGKVVGLRLVSDDDDLMLITDGGKLIRMPVDGIPTIGRNTQGVRLIRLEDGREGGGHGADGREGRGRARGRRPRWRRRAPSSRPSRSASEDLGDEAAADEDATRTTTTTTTTASRRRRGRRSRGRGVTEWPTEPRSQAPALLGAVRARLRALPRRRELARARVQGGRAARRSSSSAASGAYVYDVDGNRYIDFVGSWGPLILGHADPDVVAAIVARRRRRAPPSARRPRARSSSAS